MAGRAAGVLLRLLRRPGDVAHPGRGRHARGHGCGAPPAGQPPGTGRRRCGGHVLRGADAVPTVRRAAGRRLRTRQRAG